MVHCDEKLKALLRADNITMLQMSGALSLHTRSTNGLDGSKKRAREAAKATRDEAVIAAGEDLRARSRGSAEGRRGGWCGQEKGDNSVQAWAPRVSEQRTANSALNQAQKLSTPLAALLGAEKAKRCYVTTLIWRYIKERNLQVESNKRLILCDEKMMSVFGEQLAAEPPAAPITSEEGAAAGIEDLRAAQPPPNSVNMMRLAALLKLRPARSEDPEDQPPPKDETPLTASQLSKLQVGLSRFSSAQFATQRAAIAAIAERCPNYEKDGPLSTLSVKALRDMEACVATIKQGLKEQRAKRREGASAIAGSIGGTLAHRSQTLSFAVKVEKGPSGSSSSKINMAAVKAEPWNAGMQTQAERDGSQGGGLRSLQSARQERSR